MRKIWFLCLFCAVAEVSAQYQIPFINYAMKDGLVQNQVLDICQDHKGYIWFATVGGVSKFDGKQFRNINVSDGLPANTVTELLVDRNNKIWMATNGGGLTVFDGKTFLTYTTENGLASNNLMVRGHKRMLMEDSHGNIWCRTNGEGISVINRAGEAITYNDSSLLETNKVNCFMEDRQGRILCGTDTGLSVIDGDIITNYSFKNDDFGGVSNIVMNSKGEIWLIGSNKAAQFENDRLLVSYDAPRSNRNLTAIFDHRDRLWIAADDGLYTFDEGKFISAGKNEKPVDIMYEDSRQNIWLLSFLQGIYRRNGSITEQFTQQLGLASDLILCIFEDQEGNIWIGTNNGISMYGKVVFESLTVNSGLPSNDIMCVAADSSGNVWCGSGNDLVQISGQQINYFKSGVQVPIISIAPAGEDLFLGYYSAGYGSFSKGRIKNSGQRSGVYVYDILTVNEQEFWAGTSIGLLHVQGKSEKYYTMEDGLIDDLVIILARDNKGRIWCTSPSGLSVFDGEKFVNYTVENGLPNNYCTDISIDEYGVAWVGTENGLCRIEEKDGKPIFTTYTTKNGLGDNSIVLVHADMNNRLWAGYLGGLNTIDLKTGEIRNYTEVDGYHALDAYSGAAATDIQGNVWFGTIEGLIKYHAEADRKRSTPPRTYITDISLTDDGIDIAEYADSISSQTGLPIRLVLPYHRNNIRIEWIGIHFTIPTKNRYRFMLEGYDRTWIESSETYREYRLSPGEYTFKVFACNNDGVWNPEPVTYSFIKVRPPWWATTVAYILYTLILLSAVFLYVRWRERSLMEKNRLLEEKVVERTAEIELQKQNIITINKELAEHQREIMDSIRYAKRIQNAIMPDTDSMLDIHPDHFLFFKPRDIVSGDFYWATVKDNLSVAVAADCTGHGVPGAFMSMLGISILNEIVLKQDVKTASEILDKLRDNLKLTLQQTGAVGEQRDGMDVALCIIDYEKRQMQYAGAYNPLYLVREEELIEYKADKMPAGIHVAGREQKFTNHEIPLQAGDMLYIFSDGYIDQFGGEDNSKFKSKPFKNLLKKISQLPTQQQKEILIETHDQWKGECLQIDDILVAGIRIQKI